MVDRLQAFTRFNTQPPEGGCPRRLLGGAAYTEFQHTAARRRLHLRTT